MKFSNTTKLVLTNFSNVWKLLLYYTICTVLGFFALYALVKPIWLKLDDARVFAELEIWFNALFSKPEGIVTSLNDILITIGQVLGANADTLLLNYIFTLALIFIILPFMYSLSDLAVGEVLYGYMTSQTPYSFTGSYFRKFGKSVLYSLAKLPFEVVSKLVLVLLLVGVIKIWALGGILYVFLGGIVFLATLVYVAFKVTMFTCWMPAIAVNDIGVYKAMRMGFATVFRNFWSTFSNAIVLVFCALVVNFFFAVFTFTVGLIITLPLTLYAFIVYGMVAYFSNQGMRFYVYPDMFVTPKRIKEQETITKLKFHI